LLAVEDERYRVEDFIESLRACKDTVEYLNLTLESLLSTVILPDRDSAVSPRYWTDRGRDFWALDSDECGDKLATCIRATQSMRGVLKMVRPAPQLVDEMTDHTQDSTDREYRDQYFPCANLEPVAFSGPLMMLPLAADQALPLGLSLMIG